MRALAHAPDVMEFHDKLEALRNSMAWGAVGEYLTQTWLPCKEVNYLFHSHSWIISNCMMLNIKNFFLLIIRVIELLVNNKTQ